MRYRVLACDYDGTLATDGVVDAATEDALDRLRASGRKLVLVTGRQADDLLHVFPAARKFDCLVVENGGVVVRPASDEPKVLAGPPPERFVAALRARGVAPLSVGRVIVATRQPWDLAVLDVIRDIGLELQVVFNKGAVMVLPSGIDKASGLEAALAELGLTMHETVGVGDAENDDAFLARCECAVAVANALPALKERADIVTRGARGAGVTEIIDRMLADDLRGAEARLGRPR